MIREITVAACAPRTTNIGPAKYNPATVRMLAGKETDPARIDAHVGRFLDHHIGMLRRASGAAAQVAVIPEDCTRLGPLVSKQGRRAFCRKAIERAHETYLQRIGDVCRATGMYVVGGTSTCRNGRYYNTAIMQDPDGEVVAQYDKTQLPVPEAKAYTPGDDLPVFDTPLGRVGMLICWDIVFPEPYAVLALRGAEIVFQPTFGHWNESDDFTARSRAFDWAVPLVVSMWGGCACIIDAEGNFAARTGRVGDSLAVAKLRLGAPRKWFEFDDLRRDKPKQRRPELYRDLTR